MTQIELRQSERPAGGRPGHLGARPGILARALIREFPEYDLYWHISAIRYGNRVMRNYNTLIDRYPGADGMKTGFICASGYQRGGLGDAQRPRLIAVVLGSSSGAVRAQKAAQLFERGFNSGGLSWLTPSLGTVDALAPIDAQPPNLREEMCGRSPAQAGRPRTTRKTRAGTPADNAAPTSINSPIGEPRPRPDRPLTRR